MSLYRFPSLHCKLIIYHYFWKIFAVTYAFVIFVCMNTVMILKLNSILLFLLSSFFISLAAYPAYIALLTKRKAGKQLRDDTITWEKASIFNALHKHKAGTPTMWGGLFLIVMAFMVLLSFGIQKLWLTNNTLFNRQETYILLFAFFSMWLLGLVDDILNIKWKSAIKWITAKMKLVRMFLFSAFISYWFVVKLGVDQFNLRPVWGQIDTWIRWSIIMFFITVALVNAINITDGLDGLVGGLMIIILPVLWVITLVFQRYLAAALIGILLWTLLAFLRFNINPAKIFMGDSWALAIGWFVATLVYLINIRFGILIPFLILFALFRIELWSSALQMFRKKVFKRKLFTVAPFHHLLEHTGHAEHTIVMKLRLIQWVLWAIASIMLFYQLYQI